MVKSEGDREERPQGWSCFVSIVAVVQLAGVSHTLHVDDTFLAVRVLWTWSVEEVPAISLRLGDLVQVRPGDRLPCDGEIVEGRSALDESPITGESVPVARGPGEPVVAGSINADGVLQVRVTRTAADNTVARIVRLVEDTKLIPDLRIAVARISDLNIRLHILRT